MIAAPSPQELCERARRLYQAGDFLAAAEEYARAAAAFSALGEALLAAEMRNDQSVALLRAKQAQAALEVAQGSENVFAKGGDARREGIALANQAAALEALKRYEDAIAFYKRAAEALERAGEDQMRLTVMQWLSALYLRRFRFYDAILALQAGLAGVRNPTLKQRLMKALLFIHR